METINNKINSFQLAILGLMMGNSLFVGFGIIIMINLSKQDAWLTMLIAALLAIIPMFILIGTMNYLPDKNVFEKTKIFFGKIIGNIINFILFAYITIMTILILWTTIYFSLTQYLTKVPYLFVAIIFILTATYAAIKGIETVARTNEIAFFFATLFLVTVWLGLYSSFNFDELKPILVNGIKPLIGDACMALSYAFPPLLTLLVIPKNDIVNNKHYHRSLTIGFIVSVIFMTVNFLVIIGVISINLSEIFRYPAYFSQYKIDIAGFFQGVENFLSLHWILDAFTMLMMGLYFINRYVKDVFKIQKEKILKIVTILMGLALAYISTKIFSNSVVGVEFMQNIFPYYIALPLFIILVLIYIFGFINKLRHRNKKVNKDPVTKQCLPVVIEEQIYFEEND